MRNNTLRIVLDTNIILSAFSSHSPYRNVLDQLFERKYDLYLTHDILLEYEEKLKEIFHPEVAELFIGAIELQPNVYKIQSYFHFELISQDPDDNKFVDCAVAASAHYLVTNDKHFNVLKKLEFPSINLINMKEFITVLNSDN